MGLIHVYCGDGKGKTTCAIGLGIRAVGANKRVLLAQFLKSSDTSERLVLDNISNFDLMKTPDKIPFVSSMTDEEKDYYHSFYSDFLIQAIEKSESYDMLILDEVFGAISSDMMDEIELINFLQSKRDTLEIVLTGRNPSDDIIKIADYVSNIKKVKHPFDAGINARRGIEY